MNDMDKDIINAFQNLPKDFWDFKDSSTDDLTHGLHNYPATMIYPISRNIIGILQKYKKIDSLFDPFMGSGTILVEGQLAGIKDIYGTDLNPLAVLISKAKTTLLTPSQIKYIKTDYISAVEERENVANQLSEDFNSYIVDELKLDVTSKDGWGSLANDYIQDYFSSEKKFADYSKYKNIGYWFKPRVIILLQAIKDTITSIKDETIKNFILVAFSETVRLVSNTRNSEFKLFRMVPKKVAEFNPDVFNEFLKILRRNIKLMEDYVNACNERITSPASLSLFLDDTKILNSIPDESIDLIITSPPYGDSRTTVAYGQFSRLSLQWLDLDLMDNADVASLDRTLLGGIVNKSETDWFSLGSASLEESLERIAEKDITRAKEVLSFYVDLDKSLSQISKKMKHGSYQFWVVGNRTVKLEMLRTDQILIDLFRKYGIEHLFSITRNISNKVMPSLNSPTNVAGELVPTMLAETIVVFKKF